MASLRPKSHACSETGFSGAQTAYIGHKMPGIVHNFNFNFNFKPPVCTYRLNWARITSWEWWDEWDDTALQIRVDGEEIFLFFSNPRDRGTNRGTNPVSAWKAAVLTATLGPTPIYIVRNITENRVFRHRTNSLDIWQRSRLKRLFPGKLKNEMNRALGHLCAHIG